MNNHVVPDSLQEIIEPELLCQLCHNCRSLSVGDVIEGLLPFGRFSNRYLDWMGVLRDVSQDAILPIGPKGCVNIVEATLLPDYELLETPIRNVDGEGLVKPNVIPPLHCH